MTEQTKVAFCWYERDQWEALKRIAVDADAMDDSFDEWKKNANEAIHDLQINAPAGHSVQKVQIKVDKLLAWCEEEGVVNDSQSRTHYAVAVLKQRESKSTLKA